jgi:hypothetical protein
MKSVSKMRTISLSKARPLQAPVGRQRGFGFIKQSIALSIATSENIGISAFRL